MEFASTHRTSIDFLQLNRTLQNVSIGQGKSLFEHIENGKTGGSNGISGLHHFRGLTNKTSGFVQGDIRVTASTKVQKSNGFYESKIEYFDPNKTPNWTQKTEQGIVVNNGFFPDGWSHKQIIEELALAKSKITYENHIGGNKFVTELSNGQKVMFYLGSGTYSPSPTNPIPTYIVSAFPKF